MDNITLSLAIGLVVSLIFTELYGISAGGMIVPGYFALSFGRPHDLVLTVACAALTLGIVRFLSHRMIIYGRRRIVLMLLVGFLVGSVTRGALHGLTIHGGMPAGTFQVIGFIVPGLIALWCDRQGSAETIGSLATSAAVVRLSLIVLGMEFMS